MTTDLQVSETRTASGNEKADDEKKAPKVSRKVIDELCCRIAYVGLGDSFSLETSKNSKVLIMMYFLRLLPEGYRRR